MKEIKINVPEYNDGLEFIWEDNFKIKVSSQSNALVLQANREGLISLARHFLTLAQDNVPAYSHVHLDELNSLEDGSLELIISRNEDL